MGRSARGRGVVGSLIALLGLLAWPLPASVQGQNAACVEGFDTVAAAPAVSPLDVLSTSSRSALVAGTGPSSQGVWSARIARFDASGWRTVTTRAFGAGSSVLVGIAGSKGKGRWTVGYVRGSKDLKPISLRQLQDGRWKTAWVPRSGAQNAVLTDVAVRARRTVWAVGYRYGAPGSQMPHVVRWNGKRWKALGPALGSGERGMLTAVSSTRAGGTWIAGSLTAGQVERPYIARRRNGTWQRTRLPDVRQGVITSIVLTSKDDGWAVGYRVGLSSLRPLVLRWNGQRWKRVPPPPTPEETVLLDVDLDDGDVTISGSTWDPATERMRPLVARRTGTRWQARELKGFESDAMMSSLDGLSAHRGYLVGRSNSAGALARTCDGDGVERQVRRSTRRERRVELAASANQPDHDPEPAPEPRLGLAAAPGLEVQPGPSAPVVIVERAASAGLPTWGPTYGAVVRDFDGNGTPDVFIGGHGGVARLYLNEGGTFNRAGVAFTRADRHGCTAADFDRSGLPDLYCSFGGGRGTGIKANELVLDPGSGDPQLVEDAGGVRELLSRGRLVAAFDYDDDGRKDLVIGSRPSRGDGLPSLNRIYRWVAPAQFKLVRKSGLAPAVGIRSLDTADFDRDGRMDLLMVAHDSKASGVGTSLRLYRNTRKGLRDVRGERGLKSIGEVDAELAGLDGDAKFDLIQLSKNRIRVSLQRKGRFVKVYERKLSWAVAMAVGDADGDGDTDIFILRRKTRDATNDLILFNDGKGRDFTAVELPSAFGGSADSVYAIDHDGNGLTDFLTLNGILSSVPGPIELFAFYRR